MENKVLQDNIEQITKYDKEFANEILMFENEKSNVELAQNENGEYNLLFNSAPLHSTTSAILEAQQIASNFEDNKNTVKIIYGLGLGYLADITSQKIKQGKIIIYEPNFEIIKFVLSIAKIDALFQNNVILCSNKNAFYDYIKKNTNEDSILSISFLNSYKIYLNDIKEILYLAQKAQGENIGNINTFLNKAARTFMFSLENLKNTIQNPNISDLANIYKGKTALIACAGPSLKENIEIIKKNQDKFVIFALNPTAKLLIENGINPDFIVIIENLGNIHQFNSIDTKKYYFIQEGFVEPKISNLETRKTFNYISKDNFLNNWIRECLNLNDDIKSLGTVSYTALISAYIMGFDKIILIGQNLAYDGAKCYSTNCHFGEIECIYDEKEKKYKIIAKEEEFLKALKERDISDEHTKNIMKKYVDELNKNICTVKSQDGKDIPTKNDYAIFINIFEQTANNLKNQKPNLKLINSSNRGAQIDGFENISLDKAIKGLEKVEKLNLDNYQANINKELIVQKIRNLIRKNHLFHLEMCKISENEKKVNEGVMTIEEFFEEFYNIVPKITELKEQHQFDYLELFYLLQLKKDYKLKTMEDIKKTEENMKNLAKSARLFNSRAVAYYKHLRNCESFILE